jgi:hypothetical protein
MTLFVSVLLALTGLMPSFGSRVPDLNHTVDGNSIRMRYLLPFVRENMSRTTVLNLLGLPDVQHVYNGVRLDVYRRTGCAIQYDQDERVIKVHRIIGTAE